jgi:sugar phosphate isomerase/epimerase
MITRRQFTAGVAAGAGMAAMSPWAAARGLQSAPAQDSFEVGLELYSLRREIAADLPGTLAQAKTMGFREVEVPGYYGLTAAEFRKALDRAGLQATSLAAQWDVFEKGIGPIASDLATLGASWAILPWIPHGDRFELSDAGRAAARMNAWAADLKKAGYGFAYHPHGYEFQPGPKGTLFDTLASQTDPAVVNFEMDTFWIAWPGQDCVRLLNKYPHRFRLLHLKDLKKGAGPGNLSGSAPDEDSVAVGDGVIPWADVLSAARRQGCEKYYIEDESADAVKQIPRSLEFLQSLRF